jgi:putative endonuclease
VRRAYEHREGPIDGFTKQHGVKMLVYYEEHATAFEAVQREKNIKHRPRAWKIDLVRKMNPEWRDLFEDIAQRQELGLPDQPLCGCPAMT